VSSLNVLIAGGGIGGLTAALCCARRGHQVQVFEQAPDFAEAGAGIQLSPNCTRVLHHLGLETALREKAFVPEGTQFRHWKSGRVITENPLGDTVVERYGMPYYHMHRGDLLRVLVDAARSEQGITLTTSAGVTGFSQVAQSSSTETVQVETEQGVFAGDVLVGADGIHSKVRALLWGEEAPRFTGNVAWRCLVPVHLLPKDLVRPMSTVWWGPGKHFVHYYVRGGQFVNCVCVVEKDGWEIESWTTPGDVQELRHDFAGWHPSIQELLDHAEGDSLYKWALFDRDPMSAWGKGSVSLLGDACHPTLPFMAQGAAMAIEDAAVLGACLEFDEPVDARLERYEALRRERTAGIQNGSRRNAKVFHLAGVKAWLRNRAARAAGGRATDALFKYNALEASESGASS